jgi:hypothetical protein
MGFTIYNSTDSSAPQLTGLTGSLLSMLDSILVTGYGTKPGAGWTKPLPNTSSYGMYRLGNGSTASLFVYDAGSGSAGGAEALMTGWDYIGDIVAGAVTGSNTFPQYGQIQIGGGKAAAAGALVVRKSTAQTATTRSWIVFADSASLYLFTKPGDTSIFQSAWSAFYFGDFYSLRSGSVDSSRCMISGRINPSSSAAADDRLDQIQAASQTLTFVLTGHFGAHSFGGTSGSIILSKHGDSSKTLNSTIMGQNQAQIQYLNRCDNGLYIAPIWIVEPGIPTIRGRMRGFWHFCHISGSVTDGQTFTGSADFPSRTFQVVAASANLGVYFMETSNTLETNNP